MDKNRLGKEKKNEIQKLMQATSFVHKEGHITKHIKTKNVKFLNK